MNPSSVRRRVQWNFLSGKRLFPQRGRFVSIKGTDQGEKGYSEGREDNFAVQQGSACRERAGGIGRNLLLQKQRAPTIRKRFGRESTGVSNFIARGSLGGSETGWKGGKETSFLSISQLFKSHPEKRGALYRIVTFYRISSRNIKKSHPLSGEAQHPFHI